MAKKKKTVKKAVKKVAKKKVAKKRAKGDKCYGWYHCGKDEHCCGACPHCGE